MIGSFTNLEPNNLKEPPTVISGKDSLKYHGVEYVVFGEEDVVNSRAFEIRYEYHCSPFKHAEIWNDLLLVGFEGHFYIYDLLNKKNILALKMDGYFGHLYMHNNFFYVADAAKLYCINDKAHIIWESDDLGVDGVIVDDFNEDKIYGQGELDPPGGWRDFVLDLNKGKIIK